MTNMVTDRREVASLLAEHFAKISSGANYLPEFRIIQTRQEAQALNFTTAGVHYYKSHATIVDIKEMIKVTKNSAPGADEKCYQMLRNQADSALALLLNIFNKIWLGRIFPRSHSTAIP